MTFRVVGFEGSRDASSPVNWGVAAIADESVLLNTVTGMRSARTALSELVSEGHVTPVKGPKVPPDFIASQLVLVELRKDDEAFGLLRPDSGKGGGLVGRASNGEHAVYVFENQKTFDAYAHFVAVKIAQTVLYDESEQKRRARLVRAGLVLRGDSAVLNALHVAFTEESRRERAHEIALTALEDVAREKFATILEAITGGHEYVIKYEDGIAAGGGLNVDDGVRILSSTHAMHAPLVKVLRKEYEFLKPPPPFRMSHLEAASATLHFTASIKNTPLGERVARFLELRMLERSLRGDVPLALAQEPKVERALDVLRAPDDATNAWQTPIGGQREKLIQEADMRRPSRRRHETFVMLGYQSGLIDEANEIEVVLFPPLGKNRHRIRLNTHNDGDGRNPMGASEIQSGRKELLYQPMLFTILYTVGPGSREELHLRRVQSLGVGEHGRVTGVPSSVVPGLIFHDVELRLRRRTNDRLECGSWSPISGIADATLTGARAWIEAYSHECVAFELEEGSRKYWRPAKMPEPTALDRVLLTLKSEGGRSEQQHLVAAINARFHSNVRINNTRREVIDNPELLSFDEDQPSIIVLEEAGLQWATAIQRAGIRPPVRK